MRSNCVFCETLQTSTTLPDEVVPHLHTYLTSRYPGTPPEYWRMSIQEWPDAPRGDREAVSSLCECLRTAVGPVPSNATSDSQSA